MFEIGSSLRQARQHRGLELADVERETRIRARYLDALEEERFHVLPARAYVRGFLRTYAEFLGLDGDLYVAEYNERYAPPEEEAPIAHRAQRTRELRLAPPVVAGLVAVVAGTLAVWQLGFSSGRHASLTQPRIVPTAKAAATATRRAPARPTRKAAPAPTAPATLVVHAARGDCWVAVHVGSPTGPVAYERVLAQGGTLRFGLGKKLYVRLGAPWNADVTVRGKTLTGLPHAPVDLTAA
jgi:cytoskeletal protein RodZ